MKTIPTNWKVRITEENREVLEQWRIKQPGIIINPRITCLVLSSLNRWLISDRHDGSYLHWGDGYGWEEITYEQFKQFILMENNFTPIAMKCNQEQFKAIKPILEEHGMEISEIVSFVYFSYLTNNLGGKERIIANIAEDYKNKCNRTVYEQWNQDTFLKACGIEVKNNFTPIAMKCNQEQFDAIKPILEKHGMEIIEISPFDSCHYLTNNLHGKQGEISNVGSSDEKRNNRTVYEEWNQDIFLKACGIETNQNTEMKTYNIKISDLKKIHDVACGKWQSKIKALITDPFAESIELTQTQVDEMFKAALNGQRPVLVEVFGEPAPKHDFKEGELIWTWDDNQIYPNIRKFIRMENSNFICEDCDGDGTAYWQNAAPFNNGILPDNFKHLLNNQ